MPGRKRQPRKVVGLSRPPTQPGRSPDFSAEAAIEQMPNEFLQCRDFNHSWRPYTAEWNGQTKLFEVSLRCARCRSRRVRLVGADGRLVRNTYEYTDGYIVKGMGRLVGSERDRMRLESIRRIMPDDAAAGED